MKYAKSSIIFLLLAVAPLCLIRQAGAVSKNGTSAAQFLKIGIGARAAALGGSYTGLADDASALYWNPAGLAWIPGNRLIATHTRWFADINHDFMGAVVRFSPATRIGVSFTTLNTSAMEQTTITEPEGTGIFFDVQDIAIGLTFSRRMTDRFSFGMTAKYVQQRIFNESARTLAVDLGGLLRTGFKGLRLGIAMSNFGGKLQLDGRDLIVSYDDHPDQSGNPLTPARLETQSWPLPTSFRIGIALDLIGRHQGFVLREAQRLTLLIDGSNINDTAETLSMGLEYSWNENFFLRGGYRLNHDLENFSAGIGIRVPLQRWRISADYALTNMSELGYVQRIGMGIQF